MDEVKSEVAGELAGSPINYPRTEHKSNTDRAQIGYKESTNPIQTEHKPDTNRAQNPIQTEHKSNTNRAQIGYKESTNPAHI